MYITRCDTHIAVTCIYSIKLYHSDGHELEYMVTRCPGIRLHTGSSRGGGGLAGTVGCPSDAPDKQVPDESLQGKGSKLQICTGAGNSRNLVH